MTSKIIIDSKLSPEEAIKQNPKKLCSEEILKRQSLLEVVYFSFDGKLHQGQIVVDKDLKQDILDLFKFIREIKFPLTSVIPISDIRLNFDDQVSVAVDNTSGFNYRNIWKSKSLSNHSYGKAVDINPRLNPYFKDGWVSPEGATYDLSKPGTIAAGDKIVAFFKERGWEWGGDFKDRKDYQHFQKVENLI